MKLWLIEPYYTGSHQSWADGYRAHSRHDVRLLTLPGQFWKWRMQGGAITLARQVQELDEQPDAILASDMLNLPVLIALTGDRLTRVPIALYLHENQLTYPLQPGEKRDLHYGFINLTSALRADAVYANSAYHLAAFLDELPRLLKHFPDLNELWAVDDIRAKASVLPLGLNLSALDEHRPAESRAGRPVLVWNHRWEYDKAPDVFLQAIRTLAAEGLHPGLILLGESSRNRPDEFLSIREALPEQIVHFGYAPDRAAYARLLWQGDVVVSTAIHEFFGAAVVEACYCGCFPILPNRLAYPELIPAEHAAACLYKNYEGLLDRLRAAIGNVNRVRAVSVRQAMERFDWQVMAPRYDAALELLASQPRP